MLAADAAEVEEGTEGEGQDAIVVDGLVEFGVEEDVGPAGGGAAFAAVAGTDVSAHPEVIVAFQAEGEELVEGGVAEDVAGAEAGVEQLAVPLHAGEPASGGGELGTMKGAGRGAPDSASIGGEAEVAFEAMFGTVQQGATEPEGMLQGVAIGKRKFLRGIPEAAVGEFGAGGPPPVGAVEGVIFGGQGGAAKLEGGEGGGDGAELPELIAEIGGEGETGSGEAGPGAAFLGVPAEERGEVEGTSADAEGFRVESLPGDTAKSCDGGGGLGASPAGAFADEEPEIELATGAGGELETMGGEETERVEAGAGGEEIGKQERLAGGEGEGAVEHVRVEAEGRRIDMGEVGFASAVPELERGVEVGLQEVDGAEEIGGVGIGRTRAAEVAGSFAETLLAEGDATEFEEETVIRGGEPETFAKAEGGFVEAAETGEGGAVEVFEIGSARGGVSSGVNDLRPLALGEEIRDLRG